MKVSPVSFGTILVGRVPLPGNQLPVKDEISLCFPDSNGDGGNPALRNYRFDSGYYCPTRDENGNLIKDKAPDGTVYNSSQKSTILLDELYRKKLDVFKNNPQKVIFTEVDCFVNPKETKKKYFLTAASDVDEIKICKVLNQTKRLFALKW